MDTNTHKAIQDRNQRLNQAEGELRGLVEKLRGQLADANFAVVGEKGEAGLTQGQLFLLLQDRLTEVALGHGVYRF